MPLYQNSVIYKLKHNEDYDDTNIYIGSTSNFKNRKYCHKNICNNEKNPKYNTALYQYIRDNGNWDEWIMIPIEQYSCNNKNELEIRERYYIDILRPVLNKNIPSRTYKEYYEDNRDKISEQHKEYYQNNRDKFSEKHKEYDKNNKEKIKEHKKIYHQNNREKIEEKAKQKVICDNCGCEIRKDSLIRHQKSKKCMNYNK